MTGTRIKAIVKEFTGLDCEVTFNSRLIIEIPFYDGVNVNMIREAISYTIPAHIAIDIYLSESSKENIRAGIVWQDDEVFNLKEAVL